LAALVAAFISAATVLFVFLFVTVASSPAILDQIA
jgi:hypothetical protein